MVARLSVARIEARVWVAWAMAIALAAVFLVGPAAIRSDATTVSVANETQFRNALTSLSADTSGPHTIQITADFTVTDADGDPYYNGTKPLTIDGNGHALAGQVGDLVGFLWDDSLQALTVMDITVSGFTGWGLGGAIYAPGADITVLNSQFVGNTAPGDSASYGGAIYSDFGDIVIDGSLFTNNIAFPTVAPQDDARGGAIFTNTGSITVTDSFFGTNMANADFAGGGAVYAGGALTVSDSSFISNDVISGSNDAVGGAAWAWSGTTISGSVFQDNSASTNDGLAAGGALGLDGLTTITNTTFEANSATHNTGGAVGGAMISTSALTLRHVTLSSNFGETLGSHYFGTGSSYSLTAVGSIFTDPLGGGNSCDFTAGLGTSGGYNFMSDTTCFILAGTDISGGDPQLAALTDNGGPTYSREPASDLSPVVNVIPAASCTVGFDQRGVSRPRGANCDIGAVELLVADSGIIRLAGENRYGTAAAISAHHHPFGATDVFVSTGLNFPDALAGAAAAAGPGAPLVLTGATIPAETTSELNRLNSSDLVILGGTGVVSSAIETALGAFGTTMRLASSDRYATAVAISQYSFPTTSDVVLVAVGSNFADALAGGPAAAALNGPVLLTATNAVPQVVLDEIARLDPATIIVLGGTGVVSDAAYDQLVPLAPSTIRLFGDSRYETAVAISEYAFPDASLVNQVYIADGSNFPDALAGAAEAAAKGVPILLTTSTNLPTVVADEIDRLTVDTIYILGGTGVVSPTVATQLLAHLVV